MVKSKRELRKQYQALKERRKRDEKDQVVVGCMVFISVMMVLLFLQGLVEDITTGKGIFFVLRCLGCFVVFALPLLLWHACRYIRYVNKRRHEADFYVYDPAEEHNDYDLDMVIAENEGFARNLDNGVNACEQAEVIDEVRVQILQGFVSSEEDSNLEKENPSRSL